MKEDWLDKQLKQELGDYASEMDIPLAWDQLERKRNKKRKRGILFFLGWGSLLSVVAIALIILVSKMGTKPTPVLSDLQERPQSETQLNVGIPTYRTVVKEEPVEPRSPKEGGIQKASEIPAVKSATSKNQKPLYSIKNVPTIEQDPIEAEPIKIISSSEDISNEPNIAQSIIKTPEDTLFPTQTDHTELQSSTLPFSVVDHLPTSFTLLEVPEEKEFNSPSLQKQPKKSNWSIHLRGGYAVKWQQLKAIEANQENYTQRRSDSEQALDMSWIGLHFRKGFRNGWLVETGVQFQQSTNRFYNEYTLESTEIESNQVISIIEKQDGSSLNVVGDMEVLVSEKHFTTIYNRYTTITIPLYVGYHLLSNRWINTSIWTGPEVSIFNQVEGQIHSERDEPGAFQELNELPYRTLGMQWTVRTEVAFQVSRNVQLSLGLDGRMGLQNLLKSEAGYSERRHTVGVSAGIARQF